MNFIKFGRRSIGVAVMLLGFLTPNASCLAQASALEASLGDAAAGELLVANRQLGLCLLCHQAPIASEKFQGNLGPNLAGVGLRLSKNQLKQRIVDSRAVNPDSIMPAYFRSAQLHRVSKAQNGKTLFTEQQVDDVVAYLAALK